jgi:MFS family permease
MAMATLRERVGVRRDADGDGNGEVDGRRRTREVAIDHQRAEYGGVNWGAAFFGWPVALGFGAVVTAIVTAAGAAIGLANGVNDANDVNTSAETVSLVGAIAIVAIALIAYFAGGYVAGRMSRFDGARQGFAVWVWAIVIAVVLAVVGAIAGSEYNVFEQLNLPRVPIDEGTLSVGGGITLAAAVVGSLIAAILGGKAGESYHRRVDRAGYE